eukprot:TRINITY_DN5951_c0_g1_i2.p1 TRINITY_DN5951_c0_g1~~TRINITY_DN5951_c0_g1_i2.p1  ORF type:complete len:327 (-),score=78.13 TRINITY_DN5951_c0_g1_i2:534-1514(-)
MHRLAQLPGRARQGVLRLFATDTSLHQARMAREGGRILAALEPKAREEIVNSLADLLQQRSTEILDANQKDLAAAEGTLDPNMLARLKLDQSKLDSLSSGLRSIALSCGDTLGRTLHETKVADGLVLQQHTVPIGVLLVIFESRPDALPQVAALSIASGNGLLLKGGKEAKHSNAMLASLVNESLLPFTPPGTVSLVSTRDEISDLLSMDQYIDLVIPRGSNSLVQHIQSNTRIPVLGHADGICHVYVDDACSLDQAVQIATDSKCNYPAACNAMETLLVHRNLVQDGRVQSLIDSLEHKGVKVNLGHRLLQACPDSSKASSAGSS